jgi:hypothetical protein
MKREPRKVALDGCADQESLTDLAESSTFVLMKWKRSAGREASAGRSICRCANGYREGTRSMRKCVYRKQLNLETLVCTRGYPINDKTALEIIEVDDHEAEWCLNILEECFEHFYLGPAPARARKVALNEKLAAAGKAAIEIV